MLAMRACQHGSAANDRRQDESTKLSLRDPALKKNVPLSKRQHGLNSAHRAMWLVLHLSVV